MDATALKVAIVDDNRDIVASLGKLVTLAGFQVVAKTSEAAAAFDYIVDEQPHVVLLDLSMPFVDGYTLARRIRQSIVPAPKLVAVTGFGQQNDKMQALDAGFDAYFVKPVDWVKLEELLHSYAQAAA
jgi:DNA-binding response OmpR family regulator